MAKHFSLQHIAEQLGLEAINTTDTVFIGVDTLANATGEQISFLANVKYKTQLSTTNAGAVIIHPDYKGQVNGPALLSDNPHAAFARVAQLFYVPVPVASGIAANAVVPSSVSLGQGVSIGHNVVLGENVVLGDGVTIGANTVIQNNVSIGSNSVIHPNVTLYREVQLGNNVVVHSQTVIGADGFGFANDKGTWIPVPQIGSVIVGDDTSIGASSSIDRGALGDTVIGKNCIIDNQVQIGHNCQIGDHTCICGFVGIAGSTTIGQYVVIAGGVGINGHITICDKVQVTGFSMVVQDITEPGVYSSGQPALTNKEWRKVSVRGRQLPSLFDRVKQLEKQLEKQNN